MNDTYFIREDRTVERTDDLSKAYKSKEKYGRVGDTKIGDARVSTIFLAMDHAFEGSPLLFETMVFGGKHDMYMDRYGTWDDAVKGHEYVVNMVKKSEEQK